MNLEDTFKSNIQKEKFLSKNDSILIALSGGMDSVCLFHLLNNIKEEFNFNLSVIHLNHNLRGKESEKDLEFVKGLCEKYKVPLYFKTLDEQELKVANLQEKAREKRYEFFNDILKEHKIDKLAVAHTFDDQAETVMQRLIKGSSFKGISAMKARVGKTVRPLLKVKRKEIESFIKENKIKYREDSSNKSIKYERNNIRLNLIPLIEKEYNENFKESLVELSNNASLIDGFLFKHCKSLYKSSQLKQKNTFSREVLINSDEVILNRFFFYVIEKIANSTKGFYKEHLKLFYSLLKGKKQNASIDLPKGIIVRREYDEISFKIDKEKKAEETFSIDKALKLNENIYIKGLGTLVLSEVTISEDTSFEYSNAAYFPFSLKDSLFVRTFKEGDKMKPLGMTGTKKIKDIFIDEKVPMSVRKKLPIVVYDNQILWLTSLKRSREELINLKKDKKALKVEFIAP